MRAIVTPSKLSGTVTAPPSKSFTHRAVMLASLANGISTIENPLMCDDTIHTINVCKVLGADIKDVNGKLEIAPKGDSPSEVSSEIFVGASGTTARSILPIAALSKNRIKIYGTPKLHERPMVDLINTLRDGGMDIHCLEKEGHLPVEVGGSQLNGGEISVNGKQSSQFVSSLLMAAPFAKDRVKISVMGDLVSKPYVDITIKMMEAFGVHVDREGYQCFFIDAGQKYLPTIVHIGGDWSSASYLLAAGAICGGPVHVTGLNLSSEQGDKIFPDILKELGCNVGQDGDRVEISRGELKGGIGVDMLDNPDIVQTLTAVAAYVPGKVQIINIAHLKDKETDRIKGTKEEFEKMGATIEATESTLMVSGTGKLKGAEVDSHGDHRMVMALTVAACAAEGQSTIKGAEHISKSFPDFFYKMQLLGAKIRLE